MSWALLFGFACGDTEDDPTTDSGVSTMPTGAGETSPAGDGGNQAEDTSDQGSTSDDAETTTPATSGPGEASGDGSTGDTGSETSADTGSSSGGEVDACELQPDDEACNQCVKMNCCDQVRACLANNECSCFQECAAGMGIEGLMICGEMCIQSGNTDPNVHPIIGPVLQCTISSCIGDCI